MSSKPAKGKRSAGDNGDDANADDLENGNGKGGKKQADSAPPHSFEAVLQYLKRTRGFDFANYKRIGLARRFEKRMQMIGIAPGDFPEYQDYLEVHPDEFAHLFNTILINVTGFFRDPTAWDYLAAVVVPEVVNRKLDGEPLRVWSAACASGEEAYSLAILFAEALGVDQFCERVKIYATDVDEDALNIGRQAAYGPREIAGVSPGLLKKYFEPSNGRFIFHKEMRRCVIFGRHDLFEDAPISRVDLLACRNALMYFNAEAQGRILNRFHFALNDGGHLFLGKAEMLLTHANLFKPIDLRRRIFTKVTSGNLRDRLLALAQGHEPGPAEPESPERLRQVAFDSGPVAQLVTDSAGLVMAINERARALFGLTQRDIGRPLQDLEISYKPVELRSLIDQALRESRTITNKEVEFGPPQGERLFLDLTVTPLPDHGGLLGVLITYTDVTRHKRLTDELAHSHHELESAQEELQSTTEELETTNEELQSTVEELETTNEELQSTNEELETMNEELQSTNEELHTINDELRQRSEELNQVNGFLEAILTSMRTAVVVVDQDLRVTAWNGRAEDLWGLRSDEVRGQHFLNLDIGLPVDKIKHQIRASVGRDGDGHGDGDGAEVIVHAHNRRGREIRCKVTCSSLSADGHGVKGAILLMEEMGKASE